MGKIICAYSGCGKSTYCQEHKNCIDLDSRWFLKEEGWEQIYIECAKALTYTYDYVFLTAHTSSVLLMDERNDIEWYLVYPDVTLKDEYRSRLEKRGMQSQEWIDGLVDFYEKQITKYNELVKNKNKIILKSNQYISDIIDEIK